MLGNVTYFALHVTSRDLDLRSYFEIEWPTSFMADLSKPSKISLVMVGRIDDGRSMQSLVAIS